MEFLGPKLTLKIAQDELPNNPPKIAAETGFYRAAAAHARPCVGAHGHPCVVARPCHQARCGRATLLLAGSFWAGLAHGRAPSCTSVLARFRAMPCS